MAEGRFPHVLDEALSDVRTAATLAHALTRDAQAGAAPLEPGLKVVLTASARKLRQIREYADRALGSLARAGCTNDPVDLALAGQLPIVQTGPGGDFINVKRPCWSCGTLFSVRGADPSTLCPSCAEKHAPFDLTA